MPLNILIYIWNYVFLQSTVQHVKLQNFLAVRLKYSDLSDDAKTTKFLSYNFSRYNIKKLIRILSYNKNFLSSL